MLLDVRAQGALIPGFVAGVAMRFELPTPGGVEGRYLELLHEDEQGENLREGEQKEHEDRKKKHDLGGRLAPF